jgi:hypothetical protein
VNWHTLENSDLECVNCDDSYLSRGNPTPGLGDYTEQMLSTIGVTKDRYAAVKEAFGLAPTCDCEVRKAWLNKVGAWLGL